MHLEPCHLSRRLRLVARFLLAGSLIAASLPGGASAQGPGSPETESTSAAADGEAAEGETTLNAEDEPAPGPRTAEPAPSAEPMPPEEGPSAAPATIPAEAGESVAAPADLSTGRSLTKGEAASVTPIRYDPRALDATRTRDAGIALAVVGGILGVGALLLHLVDPCEEVAGNDCRAERRRNAALGMGLPAAALFVAGVVTASVGQSRARRIAVEIDASPRGASLGVRTRF